MGECVWTRQSEVADGKLAWPMNYWKEPMVSVIVDGCEQFLDEMECDD